MEENMIEYWIWLQQALGANSAKPEKLLSEFGSIGGVYEARRVDYIAAGFLSEKEIRRLCDKSLEKAKDVVGHCMENGYTVITFPELPKRLCNIYAPPCVLYVWGSLPQPTDGVYISMVGTRNVTPYGVEAATKLAAGLAHCGAVVVSGMAIGVDGASHRGALKGGGKTVAVIGCGIDIDYPSQHRELKRLIAQNGAVISEYPPGTRPDRANFPARNRLIAALSLGCVVVEAGSRSGSLITASLAAEMGRDVFAVPGSIFSPVSEGTNRLLRDGSKPVCNVLDILEEYIGLCPQSIISRMSELNGGAMPKQLTFDSIEISEQNSENTDKKSKAAVKKPFTAIQSEAAQKSNSSFTKPIIPTQATNPSYTKPTNATPEKNSTTSYTANCSGAAGLSETQMKVYGVLTDEPEHVDAISLAANLPLRTVLAVLTTLEIEGYAQSHPGRRYTVMK